MDDLANTLCHYTTAEAAFAHIIPSGELRMSPYTRMRDPLENRHLHFGGAGWAEDAEAQNRLMNMVIEGIRRIRDRTRLLSFTIDARTGYDRTDVPFMRAWARARMWEQYASNHAGVCVAFDLMTASRRLTAELQQRGAMGCGEVAYTPRGFGGTRASTLLLDRFSEDTFARDLAIFAAEHERDLFFTKTLDWQGEHEYRYTLMPLSISEARYALPDDAEEYVLVPFGGAESVRAVILGEQFPEWEIPAAERACERLGVELRQLKWLDGRPWPLTMD